MKRNPHCANQKRFRPAAAPPRQVAQPMHQLDKAICLRNLINDGKSLNEKPKLHPVRVISLAYTNTVRLLRDKTIIIL